MSLKRVYTDACGGESTLKYWGVFVPDHKFPIVLTGTTETGKSAGSIQYAEAKAILNALLLIKLKKWGNVIVYSDNQNVVDSIKSNKNNPISKLKPVKQIKAVLKGLEGVKIEWVKAHAGNKGNEVVDAACKLAQKVYEFNKGENK